MARRLAKGRRRSTAVLALAVLGTAHAAWAGSRFSVGVTTLIFTKSSVTTGAARPLPTLIWYPAAPHTGTPEAFGLRDATVRHGRFPLVIFSHGACGLPTEASYLTMALAGQGFVVAAPPHPGNTANDFPSCLSAASTIDTALNRVPDVRFTLDSMLAQVADTSSRFANRLRTDVVAVSGLSFGGFTTLLAAQQEPRFTAALVLVPGGTALLGPHDLTIPTMVIGAERDHVVGYPESEHAYQRLAGPRFLVELLAANHLSLVDDCYNAQLGASLCVADDITQDEAHRLVLRFALPFLRRYLLHQRAASHLLVRPVVGVKLTAEPRRPSLMASVSGEGNPP